MSSLLPDSLVSAAAAAKYEPISAGSRGFVFNADAVQLVEFLDWGTRKAAGEIRPGHEVRPGSEETVGDVETDIETRPGSED